MNVPNQDDKVLEEMLAGSNSDAVITTLKGLRYFKMTLPPSSSLLQVLKNLSSFLCYFVTNNREYIKWLSRLRRNNQIVTLPVQTSWPLC